MFIYVFKLLRMTEKDGKERKKTDKDGKGRKKTKRDGKKRKGTEKDGEWCGGDLKLPVCPKKTVDC